MKPKKWVIILAIVVLCLSIIGSLSWLIKTKFIDSRAVQDTVSATVQVVADTSSPVIASALINDTSNVQLNTIVKINAIVTDNDLDTITIQYNPPSSNPYNLTASRSGTEYYNDTIVLSQTGQWVFTFYANDKSGNNATPLIAQDLAGNNYIEVEEAGEEAPPPSQGSPSGGGGEKTVEKSPTKITDKERIKITIKINELSKQRLTITNTHNKREQVTIEVIGSNPIKDILTTSEKSFFLDPGESKLVVLNILAKHASVHTLKIRITLGEERIIIPIIIEVESQEVLFDLSLDIKPKSILPGQEITARATLFNIKNIGLVDVNIKYIIKDFQNNVIAKDQETISIETEATFSKTLALPKDLSEGEYNFIVQATYKESVGTASETFTVGRIEKPAPSYNKYITPSIVIIIIILAIITFSMRSKLTKLVRLEKSRIKRSKGPKIQKAKIIKSTIKKQNIKRKLETLKKAHKSGYISERAYQQDKERLQNVLKRIK